MNERHSNEYASLGAFIMDFPRSVETELLRESMITQYYC